LRKCKTILYHAAIRIFNESNQLLESWVVVFNMLYDNDYCLRFNSFFFMRSQRKICG